MEKYQILKRTRLIELFQAFEDRCIIYVKGQAGKGKRFAVKQFLDATKTSYTWLNLSCVMRMHQIKEDIIQATAESKKTIVLDGLQYYQEDDLLKLVLELTNSDPTLRFIILSRTSLPNELKTLLAESKLGYVLPEWLLFTREEIQEFFGINGVTITMETAEQIKKDSTGWVITVSLVLQKMKEKKEYNQEVFQAVLEDMFDYLDERVLKFLSEKEKRFLFKTSLLKSYTFDMANYILNITDADQIMESLNHVGHFVYNHDGVFTYLPIYKQYFYTRCMQLKSKNGIFEIYHLSGDYLRKQHHLDAVYYYLQANQVRLASETLEEEFLSYHHLPWYYGLEKYLDMLPKEEVYKSTVLLAARVLIEMLYWRETSYQHWLDETNMLRLRFPQDSDKRIEAKQILETIDLLHPGSQNLRIIKTLQTISQSNHMNKLLYYIPLIAYQPSLLFGGKDLSEYASQTYMIRDTLVPILRKLWPNRYDGAFMIGTGEIKYYQNNLNQAIEDVMVGIGLAYRTISAELLFAGSYIQTLIKMMVAPKSNYYEEMNNVKKRIEETKEFHLMPNYEACIVAIKLIEGDLDYCKSWLESKAPTITNHFRILDRFQYLVRIRVMIALGDYMEAWMMLIKLSRFHESNCRKVEYTETLVLSSICHYYLGDTSQSFQEMESALIESEKIGFVRSIANYGSIAQEILQKMVKQQAMTTFNAQPFLERVIEASAAVGVLYPKYLKPNNHSVLTKAEVQILQELCLGKTNEQIATQLHISIQTVKTHLKNVYSKMQVNSRSMAIVVAKDFLET